jgi:SsrA-binding protein
VQRAGYTLMPLDMHYKNGRVKLEIGLAKGKKQHDKRATEKEREGKMEAQQAMKKLKRG